MPQDFQEAFVLAKDWAEATFYNPEDIPAAEEHPLDATRLSRRVEYAIIAERAGWSLYQNATPGGLDHLGCWMTQAEARKVMEEAVEKLPGQMHFPTQEELIEEILEKHTSAEPYYPDLDRLLDILRGEDTFPAIVYWLVKQSEVDGSYLLWSFDDADNDLICHGRFSTEQEALNEMEAQRSSILTIDDHLLDMARAEADQLQVYLAKRREVADIDDYWADEARLGLLEVAISHLEEATSTKQDQQGD